MINGAFASPEPSVREGLEQLVAQGVERIPGPGNDVAEPGQIELAYSEVPPALYVALFDALAALQSELREIRCPSLVITSENDHIVPPASSDLYAELVSGPVERMRLTRSFHVATLDYERLDIEAAAVAFAARVTGS